MPLPAGDLVAGAMRGAAEALRVIASARKKSTDDRGQLKAEVVSDAEYEEMLKLQKASGK